jgi:hypothetical protein
MVQINKTKNRIMRFLRSLFVKKPKAPFPYSVKGFRDARKWAMTQPHPFATELSLWDYAQSQAGPESEIMLHIVNKFVIGILDDETLYL